MQLGLNLIYIFYREIIAVNQDKLGKQGKRVVQVKRDSILPVILSRKLPTSGRVVFKRL